MIDINKFDDVCIDNWKEHYDAPVPSFNEEEINVYEFNHDSYEPLRPKYYDVTIEDNIVKIYWLCQESWYDITGMKKEFKRWAKYWLNYFNHTSNDDEDENSNEYEEIIFRVTVEDRDGYGKSKFSFKLKL